MDWKRKFSSRKFWMAIALFASGLIVAFGGSQETADTVMGCIMQGAAVVAYIVAEGLVDQENAQYYAPKHEEK
jgi:hypothetical protein